MITSAALAVAFVVVWCVQVAYPWERVTPIVLGLCLAGLSLATGAASTVLQGPMRAAYVDALRGLNTAERAEATRALRQGNIPADAGVLAGAIRWGAVIEDYRGRALRGKSARLISAVLLVLIAILDFVIHSPRQGILWLLLVAVITVPAVVRERRRRNLGTHLTRLRTAAKSSPILTAADLAPPSVQRDTNYWHVALLAIVTLIVVTAFAALAGRPRHDCRTVDATVAYLHDHPDMLSPQPIPVGGPGLGAYSGWADQLSRYASQTSNSDIKPHMHALADRARDAASLASQARSTAPARPVIDLQLAYGLDVLDILHEERELTATCHRWSR